MTEPKSTPTGRDNTSIVYPLPPEVDPLGLGMYASTTYGRYLDVTASAGDRGPQAYVIPQSIVADAEPVRQGIPMSLDLDEFSDDQLTRIENHIRQREGGADVELMDVALEEGWAAYPNANNMISGDPISIHDSTRDAIDAVRQAHGLQPLEEARDDDTDRATLH